jgi:hypothetical protein
MDETTTERHQAMDDFNPGDPVRVCLSGIQPRAIVGHFYEATILASGSASVTVKLQAPLDDQSVFTIFSARRLKKHRKRAVRN